MHDFGISHRQGLRDKFIATLERANTFQILAFALAGVALGLFFVKTMALPSRWAFLVLLAGLVPFVSMIVGNVRNLLLAVILLDIPFQLDINIGFREDIAAYGALAGWNVSATTVALALLYGLWFVEILTRTGEQVRSPRCRGVLPIAVYMLVCCCSMLGAHDVQLWSYKIFLLLQMFLLYVYILGNVRSRRDVLLITSILLLGVIGESLLMVALRGIGHSIKLGGVLARIDNGFRVGGTVGGPNSAGAYLSVLAPMALGLVIARANKPVYRRLALCALALGSVALLLTFSRGAWAAYAVSIAILMLVAWKSGWLTPRVLVAVTGVMIMTAVIGRDAILSRLLGDDGGAAFARIPLMMLAFEVIKDNMLLGVGVNNFSMVMREYLSVDLAGEWLYTVHNKYLLVWAETGLLGLLAFLAFLFATLRRGWRCWKSQDPLLSPVALGITAAITGHMVHLQFDTFQNRPLTQMLWLLSALVTATYYMKKDEILVLQESAVQRTVDERR